MSHTSVIYQHSSTNNSLPLRSTRPRRPKPARSQTLSKLKASYSNAARAFLHHRTEEAHALVEEAFELLYPPESSQPDQFSSYRRKWDILRITLETTLYTTPTNGSTKRNEMLKSVAQLHSSSSKLIGSNEWSVPRSPLRPEHRHSSSSPTVDDPLLLSPPSLLGTLHTRSIRLFSPPSDRPGSRCLPAAVLVALVLASLKLDCPQVGRAMIEDWLPSRDSLGVGTDDEERDEEREGYEKVIEVYSLHVLPRLNEWDGAKEFLDSEAEMRPAKRKELVATLASHHAQSLLPPSPRHSQLHNLDTSVSGSSGPPTPRAASPAPSSVSSHTAVPHSRPATTAPLSPTTPRQFHHPTNAIPTPPSLATTTIAIPPPAPPLTIQPSSPQHPTIIQLLKAVLMPYLRKLNAPVVLLAIVLSFLGLISRFGRRTKSPGSGAEVARRRLMGGSGVWRGLMDAVKMSGRGLV